MNPEDAEVQKVLQRMEDRLNELGWSVPDFAEKMSVKGERPVSKMTIYRWFYGINKMPLNKYFRALRILKMKK